MDYSGRLQGIANLFSRPYVSVRVSEISEGVIDLNR